MPPSNLVFPRVMRRWPVAAGSVAPSLMEASIFARSTSLPTEMSPRSPEAQKPRSNAQAQGNADSPSELDSGIVTWWLVIQ